MSSPKTPDRKRRGKLRKKSTIHSPEHTDEQFENLLQEATSGEEEEEDEEEEEEEEEGEDMDNAGDGFFAGGGDMEEDEDEDNDPEELAKQREWQVSDDDVEEDEDGLHARVNSRADKNEDLSQSKKSVEQHRRDIVSHLGARNHYDFQDSRPPSPNAQTNLHRFWSTVANDEQQQLAQAERERAVQQSFENTSFRASKKPKANTEHMPAQRARPSKPDSPNSLVQPTQGLSLVTKNMLQEVQNRRQAKSQRATEHNPLDDSQADDKDQAKSNYLLNQVASFETECEECPHICTSMHASGHPELSIITSLHGDRMSPCFLCKVIMHWDQAQDQIRRIMEKLAMPDATDNHLNVYEIGPLHFRMPRVLPVQNGQTMCHSFEQANAQGDIDNHIIQNQVQAAGTWLLPQCLVVRANGDTSTDRPLTANQGAEWKVAYLSAQTYLNKRIEKMQQLETQGKAFNPNTYPKWKHKIKNNKYEINPDRKAPKYEAGIPPQSPSECTEYILQQMIFKVQNALDKMHQVTGHRCIFKCKVV